VQEIPPSMRLSQPTKADNRAGELSLRV
jgi:hypothetical protein